MRLRKNEEGRLLHENEQPKLSSEQSEDAGKVEELSTSEIEILNSHSFNGLVSTHESPRTQSTQNKTHIATNIELKKKFSLKLLVSEARLRLSGFEEEFEEECGSFIDDECKPGTSDKTDLNANFARLVQTCKIEYHELERTKIKVT